MEKSLSDLIAERRWIRIEERMPREHSWNAVRILVGHSGRGSGVQRPTVAYWDGHKWSYPMHEAPKEPPSHWYPLPLGDF